MSSKNETGVEIIKEKRKNICKPVPFEKISNRFFFIYSVIFIIGLSFALYANSIHNEFVLLILKI